MFGMSWKDWLLLIVFGLFAAVGGLWAGYYRWIEIDNQMQLHDALQSGNVSINR
jgi:uncharacterized membrane protein YidH (DUF202 family)